MRPSGCAETGGPGRGGEAEALAARHLERAGLRILQRNFRSRVGEIDLVAEEGEALVFVEVRHRRNGEFGGAAASVDGRKQRRIIRCAQLYLQRHAVHASRPCRFDVVALDGSLAAPRIAWIRDAFQA
jgi:putative endonuclease